MTAPLPGIKDLVTLRLADQDYAVLIKGIEDGRLVMAAPKVPGDVFGILAEALFELEWCSVRGLLTAPIRWIGSYRDQGSLWQMEICGPTTTSQRRRYVRAPLSMPALVHVGAASKAGVLDLNTATALDGTLLDLSEAGVRLVLPDGGRHARALATGRRVIVEVTLMGQTLLLAGEVLNALPAVPPGRASVSIVVILDDPGPVAAMLRKAVLQAQIEARKGWA